MRKATTTIKGIAILLIAAAIAGIINRSDFNVGPKDPFDISNEIMIKADGEFIKQ